MKIKSSFKAQDHFLSIPEDHNKPRVRFETIPEDIILELLYFKLPFYLEKGVAHSKKKKTSKECFVLSCVYYGDYMYV